MKSIPLFFFLLAFGTAGAAQAPVTLPHEAKEIFLYDDIAVNPEGDHLAWTVFSHPENHVAASVDCPDPIKAYPNLHGLRLCIDQREIPLKGNSFGGSWSPNGKELAFYSHQNGPLQLWIYSMKTKRCRKTSDLRLGNRIYPIQKPVWSRDGKEIYVLGVSDDIVNEYEAHRTRTNSHFTNGPMESSSNRRFPGLDLVAINVMRGTARMIMPSANSGGSESVSQSASGKWLVHTNCSMDVDPSTHGLREAIYVTARDGSVTHRLAESIATGSVTHPVKIAWHPKEDLLAYLAGGKVHLIHFEGNDKRIESSFESTDPLVLCFTRNGKSLIVKSRIDERDLLMVVPLDGSELRFIPLSPSWKRIEVITTNEGIAWQPCSDVIFCQGLCSDTFRSIWLRFDIASGESEVIREEQCSVSNLTPSGDHRCLFGLKENFNSPKEIYLFDEKGLECQCLSKTEPRLDEINVGSYEIIESTVDGKNVHTAIFMPPGASKGDRLPAVVIFYPGVHWDHAVNTFGGGDGIAGMPHWLLTSRGYVVISPDMTLSDDAIGKPLEAITDRLVPQVKRAAELGYIDIERVGLMGQSYGGYGTAGVISHTDFFKAAVATNGLYDLASISHHLELSGANCWLSWAEASQGRMGQPLFDDPMRYIENSPFYRADKIHTPLLLVHGEQDDAFEDAGKLFSALRRLDRTVELASYKNGGHVINGMTRADYVDAASHIIDFFNRHLTHDRCSPVTGRKS